MNEQILAQVEKVKAARIAENRLWFVQKDTEPHTLEWVEVENKLEIAARIAQRQERELADLILTEIYGVINYSPELVA